MGNPLKIPLGKEQLRMGIIRGCAHDGEVTTLLVGVYWGKKYKHLFVSLS